MYVETSILDPIPANLNHAELQRIIELCKDLRLHILTPRLCVDEFIEHKKRKVKKTVSSIHNALADLSELSASPPKVTWPKEQPGMLAELEEAILRNVEAQGLEIIENLQAQDRVTEMAVRGLRPFSEGTGDKGFKDAVIVLTILDHARRIGGKGQPLLLSADGSISRAVQELPEAQGLNVLVSPSLREAIKHLEGFLSHEVLQAHQRLVQALQRFLLVRKKQILEFIHGMPPFAVLRRNEYGQEILDLDMGKAIESIDLLGIAEPVLGVLPSKDSGGRVEMSFVANVRITSAPLPRPAASFPSFLVLREEETEARANGLFRRTAENPILVTGSVHLDKENNFSELVLDRARSGVLARLAARPFPSTEEKPGG